MKQTIEKIMETKVWNFREDKKKCIYMTGLQTNSSRKKRNGPIKSEIKKKLQPTKQKHKGA